MEVIDNEISTVEALISKFRTDNEVLKILNELLIRLQELRNCEISNEQFNK